MTTDDSTFSMCPATLLRKRKRSARGTAEEPGERALQVSEYHFVVSGGGHLQLGDQLVDRRFVLIHERLAPLLEEVGNLIQSLPKHLRVVGTREVDTMARQVPDVLAVVADPFDVLGDRHVGEKQSLLHLGPAHRAVDHQLAADRTLGPVDALVQRPQLFRHVLGLSLPEDRGDRQVVHPTAVGEHLTQLGLHHPEAVCFFEDREHSGLLEQDE
jgi:hypothetical protein